MKEVSSCQENIDTKAISEKENKKKKKKLNWLLDQVGVFAGEKCPVIMKILTWRQSQSMSNDTELIAEPIGPFAFIIGSA